MLRYGFTETVPTARGTAAMKVLEYGVHLWQPPTLGFGANPGDLHPRFIFRLAWQLVLQQIFIRVRLIPTWFSSTIAGTSLG